MTRPNDVDPQAVEDRWLTVAEIARELRVNPATVRPWVSKGTLPATRVGQRKLLIRRSELDGMLEEIRSQPPALGRHPRGDSHPRHQSRPVTPAPHVSSEFVNSSLFLHCIEFFLARD
jgi:excisionase family DNA binding protein